MYAGASGRFSTDLDFALHDLDDDPGVVHALIAEACEGLLVMEDWHNFGADYDRTLMCWYENIEAAWGDLDTQKYDEKFRRMWRYYLLGCAGGFRARELQLWQVVFSASGVAGGYRPTMQR